MQITEKLLKIPTLKIKKQFPEIFKFINSYDIKYGLGCKTFKEKLYCFLNTIKLPILCIHCKSKKTTFENSTKGYKIFCSCKCRANSLSFKENVLKTLKNKYGGNITNISQIKAVKDKKGDTFEKKYGNRNPFIIFKEEIKSKWEKSFGFRNPSYSPEVKEGISKGLIKANEKNGEEIKEKRRISLKEKYGVDNAGLLAINKKESKLEIILRLLLDAEKIKIQYKEFDIYLKKQNIIIELDGEAFHPDKLNNLKFYQLTHVINDIEKDKIIKKYGYKFYRVRNNPINKHLNQNGYIELDQLLKFSYTPERIFKKIQDVVTKETIEQEFLTKNEKDFNRGIGRIRKLLKIFKEIEILDNKKFLKEYYGIELNKK